MKKNKYKVDKRRNIENITMKSTVIFKSPYTKGEINLFINFL